MRVRNDPSATPHHQIEKRGIALSTIIPFTFPETGQPVRTVTIDGEPWFVAADVCSTLEIANVSQAVSYLDDDEKQQVGSTLISNEGGSDPWIINEPGLYSMILRSRKKKAKQFKRWITHEVLPQIRKTGSYSVLPAAPQLPTPIDKAAEAEAQLRAIEVLARIDGNSSYARGISRHIAARMLGEEPELDPADVTITCDEFLTEKGVHADDLGSARTRLGKTVAALYRARYGKDPQKVKRPIHGVHREVAVYTQRDIDLFDIAWSEVGRRYDVQSSIELGGAA